MRGAGVAVVLVLGAILATPLALPATTEAGLAGLRHPDIPPVAMTAYLAAAVGGPAPAGCTVPWSLLAGVGKVESDHGRIGGRVPGPDGVVTPPVLGIPLDGRPGVAAVADSDGGALDGDTTWDRAVGPMQVIPSTWARHAADGDGDGRTDPHDLDDAAATAAAVLCSGAAADLREVAAARQALAAYNASTPYADAVLGHAARYLAEAVPIGAAAGDLGGPIACPVDAPVTFIDSFGFPRPGGRRHQGQDLFAAHGQPLRAVSDGTVAEMRTGAGLGGTVLWLRTDGGEWWYYAHLSSFAPSLRPGDRVLRGEHIGGVGTTGNAAGTPPHLHIQWRPGGRHDADTNPYPLLDAACPE